MQDLFIKNPKHLDLLTEEEFKELFIKFKNGDEKAFEKLFMHNLKLVFNQINHKYSEIKCEKQDLVSIGNVGLVKALNSFDLEKQIQFSTYAIKCIDNEINNSVYKLRHRNNISITDCLVVNDVTPKK